MSKDTQIFSEIKVVNLQNKTHKKLEYSLKVTNLREIGLLVGG